MLSPLLWCYGTFSAIVVVAIVTPYVRGNGRPQPGPDWALWLGTLCYAAPLAAFGSQHFTLNRGIAALVPNWLPWHQTWAYFVGACFIAAGFSLVTRVQARLAASLVALTFFLFVLLMDFPGWLHQPGNRFALALALRELAFSGGALAGAAALTGASDRRVAAIATTVARYFIAIPILFYSLEQFLHADYVPGIPLNRLTPSGIAGHAFWTYFAAVIYALAGVLLLLNQRTRTAATALGVAVLVVVAAVYVPMAVALRNLIGFNFMADTLMFAGVLLLLAAALTGARPGVAAPRHPLDARTGSGTPVAPARPARAATHAGSERWGPWAGYIQRAPSARSRSQLAVTAGSSISVAMRSGGRSPVNTLPSSSSRETLSSLCPGVGMISPLRPSSASTRRLSAAAITKLPSLVISR